MSSNDFHQKSENYNNSRLDHQLRHKSWISSISSHSITFINCNTAHPFHRVHELPQSYKSTSFRQFQQISRISTKRSSSISWIRTNFYDFTRVLIFINLHNFQQVLGFASISSNSWIQDNFINFIDLFHISSISRCRFHFFRFTNLLNFMNSHSLCQLCRGDLAALVRRRLKGCDAVAKRVVCRASSWQTTHPPASHP